MEKVKIEPVNIKEHELFINKTLLKLHAAPRHLLINSIMGLATNVVELTTHETDMETMGVTVLHIVDETLKANKEEPEHLLTCLGQAGDVEGGTA